MSSKMGYFTLGLAIGAALGFTVEYLYAPERTQDTRKRLADKALGLAAKALFQLRWLTMTPRERYTFLLHRGGSLREWRTQYRTPRHPETTQPAANS